MRYLLIIFGLLGGVGGMVAVGQSRLVDSQMFLGLGVLMGGMIFVSKGLATCDIVNAINNQRRQP